MFAPAAGVAEDPATGSATGPLGAYLVRHGLVPVSRADRIISVQGVKMGRPSRLHVRVEAASSDAVTRVHVGGASVCVGEGLLRW
jgi:trans-2,3-dihydro-3-hydroxyanthranilate isomerase